MPRERRRQRKRRLAKLDCGDGVAHDPETVLSDDLASDALPATSCTLERMPTNFVPTNYLSGSLDQHGLKSKSSPPSLAAHFVRPGASKDSLIFNNGTEAQLAWSRLSFSDIFDRRLVSGIFRGGPHPSPDFGSYSYSDLMVPPLTTRVSPVL